MVNKKSKRNHNIFKKKSKRNKNYKIVKNGGNPYNIDDNTIFDIGNLVSNFENDGRDMRNLKNTTCLEYLFNILKIDLPSNWKEETSHEGKKIWRNSKTNEIANNPPLINDKKIRDTLENLIYTFDKITMHSVPYSLIFLMSQFADDTNIKADEPKLNSSLKSKLNLVKTFFTNEFDNFENILYDKYLKHHHFYNDNTFINTENININYELSNYHDLYRKKFSNTKIIKVLLETYFNYSVSNYKKFFRIEDVVRDKKNNKLYQICGISRNISSELITYNLYKNSFIENIKKEMKELINHHSSDINIIIFKVNKLLGKKGEFDFSTAGNNYNLLFRKWNANTETIVYDLDFEDIPTDFLDTLIYDVDKTHYFSTFINEPLDMEIVQYIENIKQEINAMIIKYKEKEQINKYINENQNSKQSIILNKYIRNVISEYYITDRIKKNINLPIEKLLLPVYTQTQASSPDNEDEQMNSLKEMKQEDKDIIKQHIFKKISSSDTSYNQQTNKLYKVDLMGSLLTFRTITKYLLKNLGYEKKKIRDVIFYLSSELDYEKNDREPILNYKIFEQSKLEYLKSYIPSIRPFSTNLENFKKSFYSDYLKAEEDKFVNKELLTNDIYLAGVQHYNEFNNKLAFLHFNYLYNKPTGQIKKETVDKCVFYLYNIYLYEVNELQCIGLSTTTKSKCDVYIKDVKEKFANIEEFIKNINKKKLSNFINLEALSNARNAEQNKILAETKVLELKKDLRRIRSEPDKIALLEKIANTEKKVDDAVQQLSTAIDTLNHSPHTINKTDSLDILIIVQLYLFIENPYLYCDEFLANLNLSNKYNRLLFLKFLHLFTNEETIKLFDNSHNSLNKIKQFLYEQLYYVKPNEQEIYDRFKQTLNSNTNILLYRKINLTLLLISKYQKDYEKCNEHQIEITIYSIFVPAELCLMYIDRGITPPKDGKEIICDKFIKNDSIVELKKIARSDLCSDKDVLVDNLYFTFAQNDKLHYDTDTEIDFNQYYIFSHFNKKDKCSLISCPCKIAYKLSQFQFVCSKSQYDIYLSNTIYTLNNREELKKVMNDPFMELIADGKNNIEVIRPSYNIRIADEDKIETYYYDYVSDLKDTTYKYINEENISKLYFYKIFNDIRTYSYSSPAGNTLMNIFEYDILDDFFLDVFNQELNKSIPIIKCLKKMNLSSNDIDNIIYVYSNTEEINTAEVNKSFQIILNEPIWNLINDNSELKDFDPHTSKLIEDAYLKKIHIFTLTDLKLEIDFVSNTVEKIAEIPSIYGNSFRTISDENILITTIQINGIFKNRKFNIINNLDNGDCLFYVLGKVLNKDFNIVRKEIIDFIKINIKKKAKPLNVDVTYENLIAEKNYTEFKYYDEYLNYMSTPGAWGTDIEIIAASQLYNENIYVINSKGLENDKFYKSNNSNSLSSNIYIYNNNQNNYVLAKMQYFTIERKMLTKPSTVLDISNINFDKLNDGEKCRFITLLSNHYITILRMLEIKDVFKLVNVHGKSGMKIKVSDYINNLSDIFKKLFSINDFTHSTKSILLKKNNKQEKLINIITDMKRLIISTFDNENLAYFIILHCFLCNIYNDNKEYSFDSFFNSKIDNGLIVSEFIKENAPSNENLMHIINNYMIYEYTITPVIKEPIPWTFYILALYYVTSAITKIPQISNYFDDLRNFTPQLDDGLSKIEARRLLGLKLDGSEDLRAQSQYRQISKQYHPDKTGADEAKARYLKEVLLPARILLQPRIHEA